MIAFEHGALRRGGEPELAGMIAHGVTIVEHARAISFLAHADSLPIAEWQSVLDTYSTLYSDARHRQALARLRDAVAEAPSETGPVMESINERAGAICTRIHPFVEPALTIAAYALLLRRTLGEEDVQQVYQPFETFIPLASLG